MKSGDIVHVRVGLTNVGDGLPYFPTPEELEDCQAQWEAVVPEGVKVIVTHLGVETEVIKDECKRADSLEDGFLMAVPSLHTKEWQDEDFDDDGYLKYSFDEYVEKRAEGYGPAMLRSDG